jgi:hypothetical protein
MCWAADADSQFHTACRAGPRANGRDRMLNNHSDPL